MYIYIYMHVLIYIYICIYLHIYIYYIFQFQGNVIDIPKAASFPTLGCPAIGDAEGLARSQRAHGQ